MRLIPASGIEFAQAAEIRAASALLDAIHVTFGTHQWTGPVEVKTSANVPAVEQATTYWDVVRETGFDLVITISNEAASQIPPDNRPPTST